MNRPKFCVGELVRVDSPASTIDKEIHEVTGVKYVKDCLVLRCGENVESIYTGYRYRLRVDVAGKGDWGPEEALRKYKEKRKPFSIEYLKQLPVEAVDE